MVFEAGSGCGRTCWDPVRPLLADCARLVACDRAGFGRSGRTDGQADSAHFIQAEQPQPVAERVRQLLGLPA